MSGFALRGIIAAAVTPMRANATPDLTLAVPYYRDLLAAGCDGLNLLGTTGEGLSISLRDRVAFMEAIAASDLPLERLIVGTGACALGDAVELTRAACEMGFAGALVIPPFYYRDATREGIARFYAALIEAVRPPAQRVLLYNFPRMSGITFDPELVALIIEQAGTAIAGIKDSSNDEALERALHERFPELALFPGSEELLLAARRIGLAGCISGSVCLWPALAKEVWSTGDAAAAEKLAQRRRELQGPPLITAVRRRIAAERSNPAWLHAAPPLE